MQAHLLQRNKFGVMFMIYVIYVIALIHTYDFQIASENAYAGMQPWEMTVTGWVVLVIALPIVARMASRIKGNPSDFFMFFYSTVPVLSFLTLTSTSGKIASLIFLPSLVIIVFPLLSVAGMNYLIPKLKWTGRIPQNTITGAFVVILILVVLFSYSNAPTSASFDIVTTYERRLDGRELYASGSLIAYSLAICMNGIAPFLAFKGASSGRAWLVLSGFGSVIFFYWLLGVKAPIAYVLIGSTAGYLIKNGKISQLVKYFLYLVVLMYILVLFEWRYFDGHSIIADYGFRRLFPVQAEVQGYYLDCLLTNTPSFWNWWSGFSDRSIEATYYVGQTYVGNSESNVNTTAFLYAFVANGLIGYIVAVLVVSIFLVVLDRMYQSTKNPTFLLIGLVYGLLITEQAFSTAMISSGVGLLFLMTVFEKYHDPVPGFSHAICNTTNGFMK